MVAAFPLDRDFISSLALHARSFELGEALEVSGLGDGSILTDDLGPRLWGGTYEIALSRTRDAAAMEAQIGLLRGAGRSFLAWDPTNRGPKLDPAGTILGASQPEIASLSGDGRALAISGLPAGYTLSRGDLLSFEYGAGPIRYALHRVYEAATANGSGQTPEFEVVPNIRTGATVGADVTLMRACCKAVIVPGTFSPGSARSVTASGMSFQFIQTLR